MIRPYRSLPLLLLTAALLSAQPPRRPGGFVPGQQRAEEDPAAVARGKSLYGLSCRGCHGADLRGGDMGGPNLLRSQLALADKEGEKIIPIVQNGLRNMPAFPMPPADAAAVAAYIRSVMGTIGGQGKPPTSQEPETIVVGNATAGKVYFDSKCATCHSATGDLQGIATRIADPKTLQNTWVSGGRARRGPPNPNAKPVTVTVTRPGAPPVEGRLVRIDDFLVTLALDDGSQRTFGREGNVPKVEVHDPLAGHIALLPQYSDKNMHDVTAYLVTLK
ncbi:MAG: c-type cytochrome [Bryobacteraceae bacterium]